MEKPSLDTAKAGAIRFNTDSSQMEIYDGNQWTGILGTSPDQQTGGTRGLWAGRNSPHTDAIDFVNIDFQRFLKESEKIFTLFDTLNHDNLYKIYPHKKFCNTQLSGKCVGNSQNEIYFIDKLHLSNEGSKLINVDLIKIIDKIY